jgi:hypothetical protein
MSSYRRVRENLKNFAVQQGNRRACFGRMSLITCRDYCAQFRVAIISNQGMTASRVPWDLNAHGQRRQCIGWSKPEHLAVKGELRLQSPNNILRLAKTMALTRKE